MEGYTYMKKLLLAVLLLCPLGAVVFAQDTANVAVLAYSADQLAAKFNGQNRKQIVTAISTVPTYEQTFTAPDGTEYEVVRYGKMSDEYRVFLYQFKWPQVLVGVADSPKGVLALNEKYQINIPLSQQDMTRHMRSPMITTVTDVANNIEYQAYQNGNEFYLFQNGLLVQTFDNAQDYSAFMAALTASNSSYAAQQAQQQTALEQAQINQQNNRYARTYYYGPSLGTVVVGGILWNSRHHRHHHAHRQAPQPPHAHRPQPRPGRLAPLRPSGPPAGTHFMRDVNGKFMRH